MVRTTCIRRLILPLINRAEQICTMMEGELVAMQHSRFNRLESKGRKGSHIAWAARIVCYGNMGRHCSDVYSTYLKQPFHSWLAIVRNFNAVIDNG